MCIRDRNKGLPEQWFTATVLLRDLAVMALMALVIRQTYRPAEDLVRSTDRVDDPSGGVFDGAPDAFPSWWPQRLRPGLRPGLRPAQQHQEVCDAGRDRTVSAHYRT